jgi:peptidoglycan/xylan/chitin deacetylase (PgdA/CDA1 family)
MDKLESLNGFVVVWVGLIALLVSAAVAVVSYGVRGRSSQMFGRSIYQGSGRRRSIALTFDDGPSESTPALLEYLAEQQVKATFFQCGINVVRHGVVARAVHAAGHEIGNHTYSHVRLCPRIGWTLNLQSSRSIYREFYETQRVIKDQVGILPSLLRAPYGLRWLGLGSAQKRLGLIGVMWTVIGHDWEWKAQEIADYVLERSRAGGIICLHDGRDIQHSPDVAEMLLAVRMIVSVLKERGFKFETVSELMCPDAPNSVVD